MKPRELSGTARACSEEASVLGRGAAGGCRAALSAGCRAALTTLCALALTLLPAQVAEAAVATRVWPVAGAVVGGFDPPKVAWGSGHRGVDLAGAAGQPVVAAADGRISWVGVIAGVHSLTVSHSDGSRTTYQPVQALVSLGDAVTAGDTVGTLLAGLCATGDCQHLGLKRGDTYLDPVAWLAAGVWEVRLLPANARVAPLDSSSGALLPGVGTGSMPVAGSVSSPFGWRVHPVLGTQRFHAGVDVSAPCQTPVGTPWGGTVTAAGLGGNAGNMVVVDHGTVSGVRLVSRYFHLADAGRGLSFVGQRVEPGQVVGLVGSTGLSTGCHLHFETSADGAVVDPLSLVGR